MEVSWEGYNSDEAEEDDKDDVDLEQAHNAFDMMMKASEGKELCSAR